MYGGPLSKFGTPCPSLVVPLGFLAHPLKGLRTMVTVLFQQLLILNTCHIFCFHCNLLPGPILSAILRQQHTHLRHNIERYRVNTAEETDPILSFPRKIDCREMFLLQYIHVKMLSPPTGCCWYTKKSFHVIPSAGYDAECFTTPTMLKIVAASLERYCDKRFTSRCTRDSASYSCQGYTASHIHRRQELGRV